MDEIKNAIFEGIESTRLIGLGLAQAGRLIWVNQAMIDIFGYTAEELTGRLDLAALFHPDDRERAQEAWSSLESGERELVQFDGRGLAKDGSELYLLAGGRMVPFRGGPAPLVAITNVTERFAYLKQLREHAQIYRTLMEASSDGVIVADRQGLIIEWNDAQERMTGLSRAEVLGHYVWDIQHKVLTEDHQRDTPLETLEAAFKNFIQTGQTTWPGGVLTRRVRRPDGSQRTLRSRIFPIPLEGGFLAASLTEDVTEEEA